jgi:hypothetical protein
MGSDQTLKQVRVLRDDRKITGGDERGDQRRSLAMDGVKAGFSHVVNHEVDVQTVCANHHIRSHIHWLPGDEPTNQTACMQK